MTLQIRVPHGSLKFACESFEVGTADKSAVLKNATFLEATHYKADALLNYSNVSDGSIEVPNVISVRHLASEPVAVHSLN